MSILYVYASMSVFTDTLTAHIMGFAWCYAFVVSIDICLVRLYCPLGYGRHISTKLGAALLFCLVLATEQVGFALIGINGFMEVIDLLFNTIQIPAMKLDIIWYTPYTIRGS